ncbi:MAG TPA: phenylalanine--tRNA ligase subunit beta [Candidatus Paceibacterota bacterium]
MKVSYLWLKDYLGESLPTPKLLEELITFHAFEIESIEQVGEDTIIDIDILPNRSSDCLSHRGIAKEISAIIDQKLLVDPLRKSLPALSLADDLLVTVEDPTLCTRYSSSFIAGVKVGPSPQWLKERLEVLGQRSINNIVDATNYVMFNIGQPLHAFDAQKLGEKNGKRHIGVRTSREGEVITTLDGATHNLSKGTLLITDAVGSNVLGIAGIKGGKHAEVTTETTDIVIEAAHFNPVAIRRTSRELKLRTDASLRFENRPSSHLTRFALQEVEELISTIAGGVLKGGTDFYPTLEEPVTGPVTVSEINTLLGTEMVEKDVVAILKRLDFTYTNRRDNFTITAPFERSDLHIKEDFIEEVGRIYGYKKITAQNLPLPPEKPRINKRFYYSERIRRALIEQGFSEVYTYTLCDEGIVELANPLAADKSALRVSLKNGLTESLKLNEKNAAFLGLDTIKIFELGMVFTKEEESLELGIGVLSFNSKKKQEFIKDTFDDLEKVLMQALGSNGVSGKINDNVFLLNVDDLIKTLPEPVAYESLFEEPQKVTYKTLSPYPFALRDIAVWTPEGTREDDVVAIMSQESGDLLIKNFLFDKFEKDGRISYAFHLVFQSSDRTLTDDELSVIMERMTNVLNGQNGWEVR